MRMTTTVLMRTTSTMKERQRIVKALHNYKLADTPSDVHIDIEPRRIRITTERLPEYMGETSLNEIAFMREMPGVLFVSVSFPPDNE